MNSELVIVFTKVEEGFREDQNQAWTRHGQGETKRGHYMDSAGANADKKYSTYPSMKSNTCKIHSKFRKIFTTLSLNKRSFVTNKYLAIR